MSLLLTLLGVYLSLGVAALLALDAITGRVRRNLVKSALETQTRLAGSGTWVGTRTAVTLIMITLLLFWPTAIWGAVESTVKFSRRERHK